MKASAFRRWPVAGAYSPEQTTRLTGGGDYCKNEELCILHFDIRLPVSVKNHSLQHHNDGKKVYLDKIPLYDYNYVYNHIDTKLQIQVTKIRRYGYGHKKYLCYRSRSTLI